MYSNWYYSTLECVVCVSKGHLVVSLVWSLCLYSYYWRNYRGRWISNLVSSTQRLDKPQITRCMAMVSGMCHSRCTHYALSSINVLRTSMLVLYAPGKSSSQYQHETLSLIRYACSRHVYAWTFQMRAPGTFPIPIHNILFNPWSQDTSLLGTLHRFHCISSPYITWHHTRSYDDYVFSCYDSHSLLCYHNTCCTLAKTITWRCKYTTWYLSTKLG